MVPGGDGLDVCRRLATTRALHRSHHLPDARASENDRVLAGDGADDYITKPFATRELVARVRPAATLRAPHHASVISFEES